MEMQTTLLREDIRSHKENSQSSERTRFVNFHFRSSAKCPSKQQTFLSGINRSPSVSRNTFHSCSHGPTIRSYIVRQVCRKEIKICAGVEKNPDRLEVSMIKIFLLCEFGVCDLSRVQ